VVVQHNDFWKVAKPPPPLRSYIRRFIDGRWEIDSTSSSALAL